MLQKSEPDGRAHVASRRAPRAPAKVVPVTPEVVAPAPVMPQAVEPAAVEVEPPAALEARPRALRPLRREAAAAASSDALRAEMALLRAASDALSAGQVERAVRQLDEHEREFERGQLGQEREGLRVVARCLRDERGARAAARRYLARHPESLLAVRAIGACKLESER
jgi:hypothetical protein